MIRGKNVVEEKIIDILSKDLMSTSQVAKKLNMRREVAIGYLEALMNQGKLEKTRVGRSIIYRTIKQTND
ncbi:MAG: hypothetical protein HYU56_00545 [Candidatus Aenigmarchaeota archaeon]|nr:hypothetical protein [Candidatus Aenigmarchaeota archaeon]